MLQNHFTVYGWKSHSSFRTWLKRFFGTVVGWLTCRVGSYDSRDTEHARLGNVLRASSSADASPGLAGPPACGRAGDGRLHKASSRCSATQFFHGVTLFVPTPVRFLNRFTHVRARHRTVLVRSPVDLRGDALACPKGLRYGLEAGAGLKTVLARALKCPCHEIMH